MSDICLRGLYAITPTALCKEPSALLRACEQALIGGARLIQYRDKTGDHARRLASAKALRALCESFDAYLIINDDVELALASAAHGVHLGLEDCPLAKARGQLGANFIIGVTCADSISRALAAQDGGADYVAFGAFHASQTKPDARQASPALLHEARAQLTLPICVIGGLDAARAAPLAALGADMVAISEAIFLQGDIAAAARSVAELFGQT